MGLEDRTNPMNQPRFRRLTDLFVDGASLPVGDGTHLWLQALNAFERDEAIADAQMARARLVMALRDKGAERVRIEARFETLGRDAIIDELAGAKADAAYPKLMARLEDDPDWAEKLTILRRTDFSDNTSASPEEQELVSKLLTEWSDEVSKKIDDELDYQKQRYADAADDDLLHDYLDAYMDRRGDEIANAEYGLTEIWYATRYCEATVGEDSELNHEACNGHVERVFNTKADVKAAPDKLRRLLQEGLQKLAMNLRDPKGSASPRSSSDSSPPPSEAGA